MADEKFKISIKGTGLNFDQSIDTNVANKIISFVLTGVALPDAGGGNVAGTPAAGSTASNIARLDAKQFIARKKPKTQYERIACLGFFLRNARKITEFGADEIKDINKEAAQLPISNLPQIINDTTRKYGFLSPAGEGKKQMTVLGDAIVEALPDREAVKTAHAEYRPRKRKRRAAKKKK
jgi:hypothetical protein